MNYQTITPTKFSEKIDPSVDFFIVRDHMPDVNFQSGSLENARIEYFGKNTIHELFVSQGLSYKDYFFIFDHYLNFDDFGSNGYFYPDFFLKTAINYQKFSSNHKIDFTKKIQGINCLMNKIRPPRILASCWFANNKVDQLLHTQSWANTDDRALNLLDELLQIGNLIDWTHENGLDTRMLEHHWIDYDSNAPLNSTNNSSEETNFTHSNYVGPICNITAISVVLEPVFWEHASIATEKYMHAIYGGTIPLVSGYKIYDSLAILGFDTFSDIIDTSSQYELDPVLRIWNMLENNKNLFSHWQDLILDPQIQNRIINNLILLQDPKNIFKNSIKLNSEESLAKIVALKSSLPGFVYLDKLNIPN